MKNTTEKIKKRVRGISTSMLAIMAMMFSTVTANAAELEPAATQKTTTVLAGFSGIVQWLNGFTSDLKNIGYAIGTLAVIILGIILITAGQEGLGKGKRAAAAILAGIALITFGSSIITDLKGSSSTAQKTK